LVVTKELVTMHGGMVGFTSEPGVGSCFWFMLPLGAAEFQSEALTLTKVVPTEPNLASSVSVKQPLVLIVEVRKSTWGMYACK
jgi:hypothetical protein